MIQIFQKHTFWWVGNDIILLIILIVVISSNSTVIKNNYKFRKTPFLLGFRYRIYSHLIRKEFTIE